MNLLRRRKTCFLLIVFVLIPCYLLFSNKKEPKDDFSPMKQSIEFDFNSDLLVFLHIQKTGGSDFDRNIVHHLHAYNEVTDSWEPSCKPSIRPTKPNQRLKYKKVYCPRLNAEFSGNDFINNWYFSRQTFGWYCGLHVDFTTLKKCLNRIRQDNGFLRKFHYITIIRDPVKRYISEWNHIKRGSSNAWNKSVNICNRENLISSCYPNRDVTSIELDEFIACDNNMANNRQTRMLADYSFINDCNLFKNHESLLENAKLTLSSLTYFALNEYQELSQELFERTFKSKLKFDIKLTQSLNETSSDLVKNLDRNIIKKILKLNDLDLNLYHFAEELFFERLNFYRNN